MRGLFALALIALGLAGVTAASAGDLPIIQSDNFTTRAAGVGHRAGQLVFYDYQPSVVVRAYWLASWRNRHYYPTTGEKPEIGRDEDLSAVSGNLPEAETFQRHLSTCTACLPEQRGVLDTQPAPPLDQPPGPLK